MKRKQLSMAIHGALVVSLLVGAPALAQDAPKAKEGEQVAKTLDTVTVTARRRAESIQDVPVAVSAFGEDQLKDLQASNVDGLQGAVPNMNIVQGRGSANSVNVFIRGIGQPDALQTFDPGVGMYVDDVYYSRINGALFSLFDIADVEVLRGPQGTLYGKNSTGGAVKLTTKDPFSYEGGAAELTYGDYGRAEARFYAGGKLSDTVAGSIAGAWITNDGYVKNRAGGHNFNDDDTRSVRAKLGFKPSEAFEAMLSLDYTKQDAALTMGRPMANLVRTDVVFGPVVLQPGETGKWDYSAQTSFAPGKGQQMTHQGVSLSMQWNLSQAWLLKSITAYRKLKTHSFIDIDASKWELGDVLVAIDQDQKSQELQLQFDNGSNLRAIFGAYWMREHVPSYQEAYASDLYAVAGSRVSFLRTIADDLTTTSTAAFAHASWEFVPSWTLSAGVRWTRDHKDYERTTSTFWGAPFTGLNGTVPFPRTGATWTAVTPSFSLQKKISAGLMWYASANRGFKSGGFNGRANTPYDVAHAKYNPEYVWTYETGLKMESADHRLRGGITAFTSRYKDFQARVSQDVSTFPVLNAAALSIQGLELEGSAMLGERTTVTGQMSWLDAKYDRFDDFRLDPSYPGYDPNVSHAHVPFSPRFTSRIAVNHAIPLPDGGMLSFGGDVSYRTRTWLSVDNRDVLSQPAYTVVGLYGVWDSPEYKWQVRVGVRNLTDERYMIDGQEFASVANIQTAYYGLPRNWYASVRYNF
ncbi:TonB-dependent receptor [Thermomonas haemolytica]|uniref:Iron complex outermembrane receptor protein n=1 Tax=Thermomonas haemolytica TaxID=141949 RepID=A0A4R3NAJ4_9GAMM|nr:TonB-dependent receptor [Thermomonas haemolytica]TCT25814.1 iron complex outermembrane receptor protein [Thermomonas haemolytica]TNY30131.1 TonB-dependent receptor [Thermomonas haemolytica]